jgi:hypothetical protein
VFLADSFKGGNCSQLVRIRQGRPFNLLWHPSNRESLRRFKSFVRPNPTGLVVFTLQFGHEVRIWKFPFARSTLLYTGA